VVPALDVGEVDHYARGRVDNARHPKADRLKRGVLLLEPEDFVDD